MVEHFLPQIHDDIDFKMTTSSPLRCCAYLGHAKNIFDLKLNETKRVGADGHHTTINFLYKLKLTTQIMPQACFLWDDSKGQMAGVLKK